MSVQEDEIYQALQKQDFDAIEEMRVEARIAPQFPTEFPLDPDWLPPIDQFNLDYANANAHYQSDHEMSQEEREEATAEAVVIENENAPEVIEEEVVEEP
jgi:hypothetical protein